MGRRFVGCASSLEASVYNRYCCPAHAAFASADSCRSGRVLPAASVDQPQVCRSTDPWGGAVRAAAKTATGRTSPPTSGREDRAHAANAASVGVVAGVRGTHRTAPATVVGTAVVSKFSSSSTGHRGQMRRKSSARGSSSRVVAFWALAYTLLGKTRPPDLPRTTSDTGVAPVASWRS